MITWNSFKPWLYISFWGSIILSGPALREQSIISDIHGIFQSGKTEFKRSDISSHEFREIKLQHSLYISLSLIKKYLIGEDPVPHIIIHPFPLETLKAHLLAVQHLRSSFSFSARERGEQRSGRTWHIWKPSRLRNRYKNDKNIKQNERANYRDFSWPVSRRAARLVFCALVLSLTSSSS